jgi:hypothetical protein
MCGADSAGSVGFMADSGPYAAVDHSPPVKDGDCRVHAAGLRSGWSLPAGCPVRSDASGTAVALAGSGSAGGSRVRCARLDSAMGAVALMSPGQSER